MNRMIVWKNCSEGSAIWNYAMKVLRLRRRYCRRIKIRGWFRRIQERRIEEKDRRLVSGDVRNWYRKAPWIQGSLMVVREDYSYWVIGSSNWVIIVIPQLKLHYSYLSTLYHPPLHYSSTPLQYIHSSSPPANTQP